MNYLSELDTGTTKEDLVKERKELDGITFDYALPHNWVLAMAAEFTNGNQAIIGSSFVWRYGPNDGPMGVPQALTQDGQDILIRQRQHNYRKVTGQI